MFKSFSIYLSLMILFGVWNDLCAQTTTLDLSYRLSPLYSEGYRRPLYGEDRAELSTMQRSELILGHQSSDSVSYVLRFQDRRAWGEASDRQDVAEVSIINAFIDYPINDLWQVRVGRQFLSYDDEHLLGRRMWGGTTAHDAGILKYDGKLKVHLGLAYNANSVFTPSLERFEQNNYKDLQFLWLHHEEDWYTSSVMLMNRGLQRSDLVVRHRQTFGTNTTFLINKKLSAKVIYYKQLGADTLNRKVDAHMWSAEAIYRPSDVWRISTGFKQASGTDLRDDPVSENRSFDIMYGGLHRHYGHLDYFYATIDPVFGIRQVFLLAQYKTNIWRIENHLHLFLTHETPYRQSGPFQIPVNQTLGIENDFRVRYQVSKDISALFGHAIFFGREALNVYFESNESPKQSQFFYFVFTATPRLFTYQADKP